MRRHRRLANLLFFGGWSLIGSVSARAEVGDILWTFDTGGAVFASPTLGRDGTIYLGSNAGTCVALSPTAGSPSVRWTYTADDWIDATAALAEDGTVYIGTYNSTLIALDPETGEANWEFSLGEEEGLFGIVQASPAVAADGLIIVPTSAGVLHAIEPNGVQRWSYEFDADCRSSPAISLDGRLFFGADDGQLRCLSVEDGSVLWSFPVDGAGEEANRIYGSPALDAEGNVYVGSGNGFLYSVDALGQLRWQFETPEAVDTTPAVDEANNVYFASRNGSIYSVDPAGELNWSAFLGDVFYSSPLLGANGYLYATYFGGEGQSHVVAFAPGGSEVWQATIESIIDSSLVLTPDGTLLVGAFDGLLYAIEAEETTLAYEAPWARFRRDTRGRGRVVAGTPPAIGSGASILALSEGALGTFAVETISESPLSFAWRKEDVLIGTSTQPRWSLSPMGTEVVGRYDVLVSNLVGEVISPGMLAVQLDGPSLTPDGVSSRLVTNYLAPQGEGTTVESSATLSGWEVADESAVSRQSLPDGMEQITVSLPGSVAPIHVRLNWEP